MTYFLVSLTNKCNKSCGYCVVGQWRNNPDYPDKITAADAIKFLEKEMKPGDTVELTGGEPTMFPELLSLLEWLKEHEAKAILRTNGINLGEWRKLYGNMVVVLARHDSGDAYMEEKKRHLLPHDIVHAAGKELVPSDSVTPRFEPDEDRPLKCHGYKRALFVTADGNIRFMPCINVSMGNIVAGYSLEEWDCATWDSCTYMVGAWNLIKRIK